MIALPIIIDRPGPDCSRPASDRLCVATSTCAHALTPRLGPKGWHYTRCGLDGGAEAFPAIPEPPASGPRLIKKLAPVIPLRKNVFKVKLCSDPFAAHHPASLEPRLARWQAIVGRPRVRRARVLAEAPKRSRRHILRPAWRKGWLCPQTECRYHLSDMGGVTAAPGCALIVASGGAQTFIAIGKLAGCSLQNVQQILERALQRKGLEELRAFAPEGNSTRRTLTVEERILRLLSAGSATTTELTDATGVKRDSVLFALRRLEEKALVRVTDLGKDGLEWTAMEQGAA